MEKSKYILVVLRERNGEYEYTHRSVHELSDSKATTAKRFVREYLKTFYGGKAEKYDDGYLFHGGEVYVRESTWNFISKEHYDILNRYLTM